MNRVLMLAEKLAAAPSLFTWGVEVASRLGAHGVSCSLTRQQPSMLSPSGMILSPIVRGSQPATPLDSVVENSREINGADQVVQLASEIATANGLRCDTLKSSWALPQLAEFLAPHFTLAMISRRDGGGSDVVAGWWKQIIRRVQRPVLMLGSANWSRIVVAGANAEELVSLHSWAQHWARLWSLPIDSIELRPLRWTAWGDWKTRCTEAELDTDVADDCIRYCGLKPTDLLLVSRRAACWPGASSWHSLRVSQLVRATYGSVGVLPTFYVPSVLAMLHGDSSQLSWAC